MLVTLLLAAATASVARSPLDTESLRGPAPVLREQGSAVADLDPWLAALAARSGAERAAAERSAAAVLVGLGSGPEVVAELAGRIEVLELEPRRRLAEALGRRAGNVALAAGLSARGGVAGEVGELALRYSLDSWRAGIGGRLSGTRLAERLAELNAKNPRFEYHLPVDLPIARLVDEFARRRELPVRLVLDPRVERRVDRSAGDEMFVGSWNEVLGGIVASRGLALDAATAERRDSGDAPAGLEPPDLLYLRITTRSQEGSSDVGDELLRWMHESWSDDASVAARATRALAASGWPGALDFLFERGFGALRDEHAQMALLRAAARGIVAEGMRSDAVHAELVARARAHVDASDVLQAELVRDALAVLGALGTDGADRIEPLFTDWERASERWRAFVFELARDLRARRVVLESALRAELSRERTPAALRRVALSAFVECVAPTPQAPEIAGLTELIRSVPGDEQPTLLRELMASGAQPAADADWRAGEFEALALAWTSASDPIAAGGALAASFAWDGGEIVPELARWAELMGVLDDTGRGDALGRTLVRAREAAGASLIAMSRLDELELLLGRLPTATHRSAFEAALARAGGGGPDPRVLGALAAGPERERALAELQSQVIAELSRIVSRRAQVLMAGVERAVFELHAAGADRRALTFRDALRRSAAGAPDRPFAELLAGGAWPRLPGLESVELPLPPPAWARLGSAESGEDR